MVRTISVWAGLFLFFFYVVAAAAMPGERTAQVLLHPEQAYAAGPSAATPDMPHCCEGEEEKVFCVFCLPMATASCGALPEPSVALAPPAVFLFSVPPQKTRLFFSSADLQTRAPRAPPPISFAFSNS